ncbi:AsnC family transcriptional regulator [Candidatus Woesearchaeota archaeon]|nr:AsnC family transcriptional regulator [Candidatus Woesearchaeota archaeon]
MAIKLDVKDRKILSELDMGARQPVSSIAKKVGLSREVVNYRIRQLEKRNIIQGYVTVLDTAKLGLMYCRMFFKYRKMSSQREKELLSFCTKHEAVGWIILGEGKWDIVLVVLASSLSVVESLYDELCTGFGLYFQNPYISLAFKVHEFKHNYLYVKPDYRELILGEPEKAAKLDKTDYALIGLLSKNARSSSVEIAKILKTTPRMISYRIKRLVSDRVILAFRARINTSFLGYDYYKVFLTLQSFDSKQQSRLLAFLRYHPNVIYVTKPMGAHTLEFEAMVKNANELHKILRQFKLEFGDILIDYETYFTYEVRSVTYLPGVQTHNEAEVARI